MKTTKEYPYPQIYCFSEFLLVKISEKEMYDEYGFYVYKKGKYWTGLISIDRNFNLEDRSFVTKKLLPELRSQWQKTRK